MSYGCARVLVAGALIASLVGCSDSSPDDDPSKPSDSDSAAPAPGEPGGVAPPDGLFVDDAPADKISQVTTVRVPKQGSADATSMLGPVFTDELILFVDDHDFLHALDRETGKQRWQVKRRSKVGTGSDTPCALIRPTVDAQVVVINHGGGPLCGYFTAYSLADGSITESYASIPEKGREIGFELASNTDLVEVDGKNYVIEADQLLTRFEADGTTTEVGNVADLVEAPGDWDTNGLSVLPGSDVMVSRMTLNDGEFELDEDEDGKFIGFRVGEDAALELVWEQDIPQLLSKKSSPGHVKGKFFVDEDLPGVIVDLVRSKGREFARYRALDPETGTLGSPGYTFDRSSAPEIAAIADPVSFGTSLRADQPDDRSVFTPVVVKGNTSPTKVQRLDLDSGEPLWSWSIPGADKAEFGAEVGVASTSADGALVYVWATVDIDARLYELDAATGEAKREWKFSSRRPEALDLSSANVSIDDGDIFQMVKRTAIVDVMAALYR